MKAICLTTGTTELKLVDRPQPSVKGEDEVLARVIRVGICGTDREEASGWSRAGSRRRQGSCHRS